MQKYIKKNYQKNCQKLSKMILVIQFFWSPEEKWHFRPTHLIWHLVTLIAQTYCTRGVHTCVFCVFYRYIREKNRKKECIIYRKKERKTHFFFFFLEVFDIVSSKIFQIGLKWVYIFRKIFRIKIKNRKKSLCGPPVDTGVNNVPHAV